MAELSALSHRSRAGLSGAASVVLAFAALLGVGACSHDATAGPHPSVGQTVAAGPLFGAMVKRIEAQRTVHFSSQGPNGTGQGDIVVQGSQSRLSFSGDQNGDSVELRVFSDAVYIADHSQPGRSWLRLSANGGDQLSVMMAPVVAVITASLNPANQVRLYADAPPFTTVGTERIGDTDTTHYRGSIQASAMLQLLPPQVQPLVKDRLTGDVAVEAWIDGDGLPVRIRTAKPGEEATVTTYTQWGQDVDVARPSSADVADAPRLPTPPTPSASP